MNYFSTTLNEVNLRIIEVQEYISGMVAEIYFCRDLDLENQDMAPGEAFQGMTFHCLTNDYLVKQTNEIYNHVKNNNLKAVKVNLLYNDVHQKNGLFGKYYEKVCFEKWEIPINIIYKPIKHYDINTEILNNLQLIHSHINEINECDANFPNQKNCNPWILEMDQSNSFINNSLNTIKNSFDTLRSFKSTDLF